MKKIVAQLRMYIGHNCLVSDFNSFKILNSDSYEIWKNPKNLSHDCRTSAKISRIEQRISPLQIQQVCTGKYKEGWCQIEHSATGNKQFNLVNSENFTDLWFFFYSIHLAVM